MLIATSGTGSMFMSCMVPEKPTVISMKLADNKETTVFCKCSSINIRPDFRISAINYMKVVYKIVLNNELNRIICCPFSK